MPLPPPTQTITVVPPGVYGPGAKTFPARAIPDNITGFDIVIDTTNRPVTAGLEVVVEMSFDGGVTWNPDGSTFPRGAALAPGDDNPSGGVMGPRVFGLQMVPNRMVRGQANITGSGFQTSMLARLWTV